MLAGKLLLPNNQQPFTVVDLTYEDRRNTIGLLNAELD
jgi:hypothetical protein